MDVAAQLVLLTTVQYLKKSASAGNRTRIYCLEGNNANLYTTDAGHHSQTEIQWYSIT